MCGDPFHSLEVDTCTSADEETGKEQAMTCGKTAGWLGIVLVSIISLVLTGCEDGGGGSNCGSSACNDSQGYIRVYGEWSGQFYVTGQENDAIEVTAVVSQDRDAVIIRTDRPSGVGQLFVGFLEPDGSMGLIDSFDGEIWTTYYGPATEDTITIADFIPVNGSNFSQLNVITLVRTG
jgi:hypothetical protein